MLCAHRGGGLGSHVSAPMGQGNRHNAARFFADESEEFVWDRIRPKGGLLPLGQGLCLIENFLSN